MRVWTAIYDASILYPAPLRDLFIRLAVEGLVRAKWSRRIQEEWIQRLLEKRPDLRREQLERTRTLMEQAVLDPLVEGYEYLIPRLALPDPNDRHVLAAAIHAEADCIITTNLRDFPRSALDPYDIAAIHPDDFIMELADMIIRRNGVPNLLCRVIRKQRLGLQNPPLTPYELLHTFERLGLQRTAHMLRHHIEHL